MMTMQSIRDHKHEHKCGKYKQYVMIKVNTNAGNTEPM